MTSEEAITAVFDALNRLEIPYLIVGSLSSNVYGVQRGTKDADFVVEFTGKAFQQLSEALVPAIKIDPQMQFETNTLTYRNEARVTGTDFTIEFFHLSDDEFDRERFRRRKRAMIFDREISIPTAEDVIIMKSRWARPKDKADIMGVIAVQGDAIDWPYVYSWADKHGTRQLIDDIRASIPVIDPE